MQIANTFPQGGAPDLAGQLEEQHSRHRRIFMKRAVRHWWPLVPAITLGGLAAGIGGLFTLSHPLYVLAPVAALVVFYHMARRVELGLLILAIGCSPFFPQALQVKAIQ